jgi:hypothetical protein
LYLSHAEHICTDLGSKIYRELIAQLKPPNTKLQVTALSNSKTIHQNGETKTNLSPSQLFGQTTHLLSQPQLRNQIPPINHQAIKHNLSEHIREVDLQELAKKEDFNKQLLDLVEARVQAGDQRIMLRVKSRAAIEELQRLCKERNINFASFDSLQSPPYRKYSNSRESSHHDHSTVLDNWGTEFKLLIHCKKFDGLEMPADTLIVADHTESDEQLEKILTPIRTINPSKKTPNHLYYLANGRQMTDRLKAMEDKHSQWAKARIINGGGKAAGDKTRKASAPAGEIDTSIRLGYIEKQKIYDYFWDKILPSKKSQIDQYAQKYLEHKAQELSHKEQELDSLADYIRTGFQSQQTEQDYDLADIYRFILKQENKTDDEIRDLAAKYPSILGITSIEEANERVFLAYKAIYQDFNGRTAIDDEHKINGGGEKLWKARSAIIAECLYPNFQAELCRQNLTKTGLENQDLEDLLRVMLGTKEPRSMANDAISPVRDSKIKLDFDTMLAAKKAQRERLTKPNELGLNLEQCKLLVDKFLIMLLDKSLINGQQLGQLDKLNADFVNALYELRPISGKFNRLFYRFVVSQKPELKEALLQRPELLEATTNEEVLSRIKNIKVKIPENLTRMFKKVDLKAKIAEFLLNKYPKALAASSKIRFEEIVRTCSGERIEPKLFREFIEFCQPAISKTLCLRYLPAQMNINSQELMDLFVTMFRSGLQEVNKEELKSNLDQLPGKFALSKDEIYQLLGIPELIDPLINAPSLLPLREFIVEKRDEICEHLLYAAVVKEADQDLFYSAKVPIGQNGVHEFYLDINTGYPGLIKFGFKEIKDKHAIDFNEFCDVSAEGQQKWKVGLETLANNFEPKIKKAAVSALAASRQYILESGLNKPLEHYLASYLLHLKSTNRMTDKSLKILLAITIEVCFGDITEEEYRATAADFHDVFLKERKKTLRSLVADPVDKKIIDLFRSSEEL